MNSFLRALHGWLDTSPVADQPRENLETRRPYISRTSGSETARPAIVVKRLPRPYWEERGWEKQGRSYKGNFQTAFGSWAGCAAESPSHRVDIYIHNPPAFLQRHSHWHCFQARGGGWFYIHPVHHVSDVSAAILSVEKTITESHEI